MHNLRILGTPFITYIKSEWKSNLGGKYSFFGVDEGIVSKFDLFFGFILFFIALVHQEIIPDSFQFLCFDVLDDFKFLLYLG